MNSDIPSHFKIEAVSMSVESQVRRPMLSFLSEITETIPQQVSCASLDALRRGRFTLTPVYRFFDDFRYFP
jgi:hypothetical protein